MATTNAGPSRGAAARAARVGKGVRANATPPVEHDPDGPAPVGTAPLREQFASLMRGLRGTASRTTMAEVLGNISRQSVMALEEGWRLVREDRSGPPKWRIENPTLARVEEHAKALGLTPRIVFVDENGEVIYRMAPAVARHEKRRGRRSRNVPNQEE